MELWQKILCGTLVVGLLISIIFGLIKVKETKEQNKVIFELQSKISELSSEEVISVLRVSDNIKSGTMFDPTKIEVATLPKKYDNDSYIKDAGVLKNAIWRLDLTKGSIITDKMLALEPILPTDRYQLIMINSMTPSTQIGDFVDIRMITPDGIDLTVLPKKRVINIYSSGLEVKMSETEKMIYNGCLIDIAMNKGTVSYADKYVDPTLQNKLYSTYIPPDDIVDYMNINKNMLFPYIDDGDFVSVRKYIESVQPWNKYKDTVFNTVIQEIKDKETKISGIFGKQMTSMQTARVEYASYMKEQAQLNNSTFTGTNTQTPQLGISNVQEGQLSGGANLNSTINPDGTYIDSDGVKRYPDGTPVIQASDIVGTKNIEQSQSPLDGEVSQNNLGVNADE